MRGAVVDTERTPDIRWPRVRTILTVIVFLASASVINAVANDDQPSSWAWFAVPIAAAFWMVLKGGGLGDRRIFRR